MKKLILICLMILPTFIYGFSRADTVRPSENKNKEIQSNIQKQNQLKNEAAKRDMRQQQPINEAIRSDIKEKNKLQGGKRDVRQQSASKNMEIKSNIKEQNKLQNQELKERLKK